MSEEMLSREQALLMLNDHLGEEVYCGLRADLAATDERSAHSCGIFEVRGKLGHLVSPHNASPQSGIDLETFGWVYTVGEQMVSLPPMPGTVTYLKDGIDFALTDWLTLRIAWGNMTIVTKGAVGRVSFTL